MSSISCSHAKIDSSHGHGQADERELAHVEYSEYEPEYESVPGYELRREDELEHEYKVEAEYVLGEMDKLGQPNGRGWE